jgi:hypothetical protein
MRQRSTSLLSTVLNPQLSLFIVFEKKVGLIRIINSAVGEVAFFEDTNSVSHATPSRPPSRALPGSRTAAHARLSTVSAWRGRTEVLGRSPPNWISQSSQPPLPTRQIRGTPHRHPPLWWGMDRRRASTYSRAASRPLCCPARCPPTCKPRPRFSPSRGARSQRSLPHE